MFQAVIESIQSFGTFSPDQLAVFESKLCTAFFHKNDYILKEGRICHAFYFLLEGSCIQFLAAQDGTDNVVNLYVEGNWFSDYQSLTSQKISTTNIQAFEDCRMALFDIVSLHDLIQESPAFFRLGRLFDVTQYADIAASFQSPEEKYLNLLNRRPELIRKFPLKYIASHLHIAPETLSRIRKRIR
jgi:CRP-like cAMP-binding protein